MKIIKLNLCGSKDILKSGEYKNNSVVLTQEQTSNVTTKNYCIGNFLDPISVGLDSKYKYKIVGGSTISGTPARRYVNSFNPIKELVVGRKSALKVFSKYVTSNWSVLDLLVLPL